MNDLAPLSPLFGETLRQPPSNIQAEQALLGAILANNAAYERVRPFLKPTHFVDPVHARIYTAAARRIEAGRLADPLSLKAEFENSGVLAEVGGVGYLAQLLSTMVGVFNAGEYGLAVLDTWLRRQAIEVGENLVNSAFGAGPDVSGADVLAAASDALLHLAAEGGANQLPGDFGSAVENVLQASAAARQGAAPGVLTGIPVLDKAWRGLWPGALDLVGARMGQGKTALAMQIAHNVALRFLERAAAENGKPDRVQLFSLEMSRDDLALRALSTRTGIPSDDIRDGSFPATSTAALGDAALAMRGLPIEIIDHRGQTAADVIATMRSGVKRRRVKLAIIDHLLKFTPGRDDPRELTERLRATTGRLKDAAGNLGIPVLLLHQLSRAHAQREDPRPRITDLMNAGEQDADNVLLLWQPGQHAPPEPKKKPGEKAETFADRKKAWDDEVEEWRGMAEIILEKRRSGPRTSVKLAFDAVRCLFGGERPAAAAAPDEPPGLWEGIDDR